MWPRYTDLCSTPEASVKGRRFKVSAVGEGRWGRCIITVRQPPGQLGYRRRADYSGL